MNLRSRLTPPTLRTLEGEAERSATWLELFFDLVFVVAVAVLGTRLAEAHDFEGVLTYLGYFFMIWWLWASHTFYANRYDTDDLVYRLLATAELVAVAVIAAAVGLGESNSPMAFAIGYTIARLVLLILYWRTLRHVPATRPLVSGYLVGIGIAASLWAFSIFVSGPTRFVIWTVAIAIDLITPWVMRREQAKVPLDTSHLPERFGLFTILVLGESIAATVFGLQGHGWTAASTFAAVVALVAATSLWWLYFDNVEGAVVRRTDPTRRSWRPTVWIYSHFGLAAGLGITAIGMEHAIAEAGTHVFDRFETWQLVGGAALAVLSLALMHIASGDATTSPIHNQVAVGRILAAVGILGLGLFEMRPQSLVFGLAVILIAAATLGTYRPAGPPD